MQYGMELYPYHRVSETKGRKKLNRAINYKNIGKVITFFILAFLISRVKLINSMLPFGIAFLIAILNHTKNKEYIAVGFGIILGYISLLYGGSIKEVGIYIILAITVGLVEYILKLKEISVKKQLITVFSMIFIEVFLYKLLVYKQAANIAFLFSLCLAACIYPIYFIFNYSIICFGKYKTRQFYNNEEIISMAVTFSIVIAGIGHIAIYGITVRNVLSLFLVCTVSYINGSSIGAASGAALGLIVGVSSKNMAVFISIYSLCGLITGVFKNMGKYVSALAFLISACIMTVYSNIPSQFKLMEVVISSMMFVAIPDKLYKELSLEFDISSKQSFLEEGYTEKIKKIFAERLNNFSNVLYNMSNILKDLVGNDKLMMKSKSSALVENLASCVCGECSMNNMCWGRELHSTYDALSELIENYQESKPEVPYEIERKCVKRTALIKNTERIVNNFIISEMWRSRLSEGRELISSQILNMAYSINEIVDEFNSSIKFNGDVDKILRKALNKTKIKYKDVSCMMDKKQRLIIKVCMESCAGRQICIKRILPIVNKASQKCMCVRDEGCIIDPKDNFCTVTFEEMPKYHAASSVVCKCKDGEEYSGDNYYFNKLNDGTYMTIISDGMGSGPQAGEESEAVINLIEKLIDAGFSKTTAINTVNSLMTMKFCESEKFSTVDLSSIDLYTGDVEFVKVGCAASFIKSGNKVYEVSSKTLPIGVLDKADIDVINDKVQNGDMIIMISDGILDYDNENAGKTEWLIKYLESSKLNTPKELSQGIIDEAEKLGGGKVKDDMTVIVSKVYSLY